MSATPIYDRIAELEAALAEAFRQQSADVEDHHGHIVAFVDFDGRMLVDRPQIDVTRLARDVERALS